MFIVNNVFYGNVYFMLYLFWGNFRTFLNNREELTLRIKDTSPDIFGITELKPKNASTKLQTVELNLSGYGYDIALIPWPRCSYLH